MTNKVNGGVQAGEFLTGKMDFFTISTLVPVAQTNVDTPVGDLYQISSTVWSPVTVINGAGSAVTYATRNDYIAAWEKQQNLDSILKVFAVRANPVAVSVSTATVADPSAAGFGSDYGSSMTVATINVATEKTGLWFAGSQGNFDQTADDTNLLGYQLASAMQGVAVYNTAGVLDSAVIETADAATTNTLFARRTLL